MAEFPSNDSIFNSKFQRFIFLEDNIVGFNVDESRVYSQLRFNPYGKLPDHVKGNVDHKGFAVMNKVEMSKISPDNPSNEVQKEIRTAKLAITELLVAEALMQLADTST